jgi:alanyl-tRNA synthetase
MTTERLYYSDSYARVFSARVVARDSWQGRPAVALDRSAFYPEGGGQPADVGAINGVRVLDVQARDGVVWHVLERALDDDAVRGEIDWARRFDHMQQHHGQHLLSAAFVEALGIQTASFHLGAAASTIDLDAAALSAEQVAAAEALANAVVWENQPVQARFVSAEELAALPLRKAPTVSGPVRVVSVEGFDHSACGGTHPSSTGGVGLIAVRGWSRQKSGVRVEFVCGGRALRDYQRLNGIASQLAAGLSVAPDDLPATIERLRASEASARKALEAAQGELLDAEAARLLAGAAAIGSARVVRASLRERPADALRGLAQRIAAAPGAVALLGLHGERAQLLVARAEGVPLDAAALLRAALPLVGGKGGGSPALAQGGGPNAAGLEAALDAAVRALDGALTGRDA